MSERWKVVIIGGGFGGLSAAQSLKSDLVDVTLIDRRNYHLFQPLLYQVATGSLSPGEIAAPLRGVLSRQKNARVWLGTVGDIDPDSKRVFLADGAAVPYDSLIVAAGSQTSYFGHNEWQEWAPGLKSIEEATTIRHKILYAFEAAERVSDPRQRRAWLTFAIVGAGPTGVELSGAVAEIARQTLKDDFRSIHPEEAQVILLDFAPRVLMPFSEDLSEKANRSLAKLGVQVKCGAMVKHLDEEGLTIESGGRAESIAAKTVTWAGGITASSLGKILAGRTKAETDKGGRVKVKPDLTIPNHPDIYVIGDLASAADANGKPLPGLAQVAMQGGTYAAKAILRRVKGQPESPPFHYFDKGSLAVIGRAAAVADVFGLHISGLLAWLVWAFIHLMYLVTFQSRILVFIQWAIQDLTFSRGARLITGAAPTDFNFNRGGLTSARCASAYSTKYVQIHPDTDSFEHHMRVLAELSDLSYKETLEGTTNIRIYGQPTDVTSMKARVLVVYCHPNPKSFTHAVLEVVLAGLGDGCEVKTVDLYAEGFDPVLIVDEERRRRDLDKVEATRAHREQIAWCDTMVFVYPVWWGGFPAMLKGYLDRTFVSGLTYSFQGRPKTAVFPAGLMLGKAAHFFYTLDSPWWFALLDPGWFSNLITVFRYCGFGPVRRHYLARLKLTSDAQRVAWLGKVRAIAAGISAAPRTALDRSLQESLN